MIVSGDFCRLTQVVSNLLINAAKFTPDDGDIQVLLARDGRHAVIAVKDSGIGLEPAEMTCIFDAFRRGTCDTAEARDGLGLGLAIARELVELHGGELTVSSEGRGRGSEFVVRLPTVVPS
jgi:signal transduction histidine kinase